MEMYVVLGKIFLRYLKEASLSFDGSWRFLVKLVKGFLDAKDGALSFGPLEFLT